jgi:RNA polymerase sigma factor (sigma-70 family)
LCQLPITNYYQLSNETSILIKGCKKFDRLSQEKLYRIFYSDLLLLCRKFFDDHHDILTALNNGMVQIFNNIDNFDETKGELKAWMYTIVRNAAISHVRTKSNATVLYEISDEILVDTSLQHFNETATEQLYKSLSILNLATRAVINLYYFDGFIIKEIATALEMKEGTVKWHLNEGRNKLKLHFSNTTKNNLYA